MVNTSLYSYGGGGSISMKKKYASKFNKISSNKTFSLNGNNHHSYIGNPNSNFTNDPFSSSSNILLCKTPDNTIKTSVKNYHSLYQTRIVNNELKTNSVNSLKCYKENNKELIRRYEKDIEGIDLKNCDSTCNEKLSKAGINKHIKNKDSSSLTESIKSRCLVDRSNYSEHIKNKILCNESKKCNITKDLKEVNAYIPSYDIYMLNKKKCNYNPPDINNSGKCDYTSIKNAYPSCS